MKTLGELIKYYRTMPNINATLSEVAKNSKVSQPYLSMVENDKKTPSIITFFRIIERLAALGAANEEYDAPIAPFEITDNEAKWIDWMLNKFLETFGVKNDSNDWVANPDLDQKISDIFSAIIVYGTTRDHRVTGNGDDTVIDIYFPSRYFELMNIQRKTPMNLQKFGDNTSTGNSTLHFFDLENILYTSQEQNFILSNKPLSTEEKVALKILIIGMIEKRKEDKK